MGRKNISQEKIIQAFLACSFEKSAGATSLSDIAEMLEIKKASLYNHFDSRDAMYDATVYHCGKQIEKITFLSEKNLENIKTNKLTASQIFKKLITRFFELYDSEPLFQIYTFIHTEQYFNIEALKAQSVVARTYVLKRMHEGKSIIDTTMNQIYKDNDQLKSMWGTSYSTYYNKIKQAVIATTNLYITYNGYYIDALYHSTSNGITEDPINVWGGSFPYLVSVDSHWDLTGSSYLRNTTISVGDLSNILGIEINNDTPISVIGKTSGNRVDIIKIGDHLYNGIELRNLLNLRSSDFTLEINNDIVTITTRGYGHGVGMSQYGANGMANEGYNFYDIINHYYPNTTITS